MKEKIAMTMATLFLVVFPFLVGTWISKYTPYVETNSFQLYVIICAIISIAFVLIAFLILKYFQQSFENIAIGGALLFLMSCPIVIIYGLASAPDLTMKMLEHPEREHIRYISLFLAAILFGGFTLLMFRSNSLKIKKSAQWILTAILVVAFIEFFWEFTHHYLYPEALKEWLSQGKKIEDFGKNYDDFEMITSGVIGRYAQFISIIWISILLYKSQQITIWSPIVCILFSLTGIVSATVIFITEMNLPKGFEFLFLFFIPGIPFILLYWLGVAMVTKFKKSDIAR